MRKIVCLILLLACAALAGCGARGYRSDFFEKDSVRSHLTEKSRLSGEDPSAVYVKHDKKSDVLSIWKVDEVEMEFRYDRDDDHVYITSAHFYATYETKDEIVSLGDELDVDTISEIDIEWWPQSDGTIHIDDVFFYGADGIYGFHLDREIPG